MPIKISVNYIYLSFMLLKVKNTMPSKNATTGTRKTSYISLSSSDVGNISDNGEYLRFTFTNGRESCSFYYYM